MICQIYFNEKIIMACAKVLPYKGLKGPKWSATPSTHLTLYVQPHWSHTYECSHIRTFFLLFSLLVMFFFQRLTKLGSLLYVLAKVSASQWELPWPPYIKLEPPSSSLTDLLPWLYFPHNMNHYLVSPPSRSKRKPSLEKLFFRRFPHTLLQRKWGAQSKKQPSI